MTQACLSISTGVEPGGALGDRHRRVGIREAFVYAVRLALDRVRVQLDRGALNTASPEQTSPEQLLALLRDGPEQLDHPDQPETSSVDSDWTPPSDDSGSRIESSPASVASVLLEKVLAGQQPEPVIAASSPHDPPKPPTTEIPSGAIWPPVEGRAILHEVSQVELIPRRHANGDWSAGLGTGWRLVSKADAYFDSLDAGRQALIAWARVHVAFQAIMSPHRCIVLASTGTGHWRLWQVVRAEESLRELVERASMEANIELVLEGLCRTTRALTEVNERLATSPYPLPCSLDTVGVCESSGLYIGLMPATVDPEVKRTTTSNLVSDQLGPMLALDLAALRDKLVQALEKQRHQPSLSEPVPPTLANLLVGGA